MVGLKGTGWSGGIGFCSQASTKLTPRLDVYSEVMVKYASVIFYEPVDGSSLLQDPSAPHT